MFFYVLDLNNEFVVDINEGRFGALKSSMKAVECQSICLPLVPLLPCGCQLDF